MECSRVFGMRIQLLSLLITFYLTQIEISVSGTISRLDNQNFGFLNKSEKGFIPSAMNFYPSFDYTSTSTRQNPTLTATPSYFDNEAFPTQFQQYSHTHPSNGQQFQNNGEASQQHREILFPQLPIGYYPPPFGIGTTIKPQPSTNPYPILDFRFQNPYQHFSGTNVEFPYAPPQFSPSRLPQSHPQLHDGFDVGTLPKQVRVPGEIRIDLQGKDAEISCEFPKYLILIQGIYWHHKYNDPFGSYFDTQNGFGSHTTVRSVNQWKSILVIQDFNADDFGFYRCISAAVLPSEAGLIPSSSPSPPPAFNNREAYKHFNQNPTRILSTTESLPIFEFNSGETMSTGGHDAEAVISQSPSEDMKSLRVSRYTKNSRKMRFPPPPVDKKVRFTRFASMHSSNDFLNQIKPSLIPMKRYYTLPDISPYPHPMVPNHLQNYNYRRLTNPYVEGFPQHHANLQPNERHLPHFHYPYPDFGYVFPPPPPPPPPPTTSYPFSTGFGLKVPYYQPTFSYFTIYQEIKFEPPGVVGRHSIFSGGG